MSFYDTGIGKEGYSIIGQAVLRNLMVNRRRDEAFIDEAAGIVKLSAERMMRLRSLMTRIRTCSCGGYSV